MRPRWETLWFVMIVIFFRIPVLGAQTQTGLDEQACAQFHKTDAELNETYSKVLKKYASEQQFVGKLKTAQRACVTFRDAELEALYPKDNKQAEYGTAYPMCRCSELQLLTKERTKQLKRWLDGTLEGDVCAGSAKTARQFHADAKYQAAID